MSLDHSELVVGDSLSPQVAERARRAAWLAASEASTCDGLPIRVFPILAQLPGGEQHIPIAVLIVDSGTQCDLIRARIEQLTELIGDTLLLSQESVGDPSRGVLPALAFRRLTLRWAEVARVRGVPLSVLAVAIDGSDEPRDEAVAFLARELPPATALGAIGDAVTAILLAGAGGDEAAATGSRLARAFAERTGPQLASRAGLAVGIATLGADLPGGELVRAAYCALRAARQQRPPIAAWSPALPAADPDDLLPDIDTVSGAEYQRIMASWRDARRHQQETADRLRQQTLELRRLVRTHSGLIGNHASMQTVFRMIERSRTSSFPLVLTGETGTGKEAVARLVHRMSNRRGPFVVVDCGAIPGALLETELFGHEKGAFTGADSRKIGHFEAAHKGTIFLDEIGELPLELQPKLLRVLQESTVRRLGGRDVISVDFRLIAATHRDLAAMVEEGTFRQDLYFRLRVLEIELPPLRARGDDILLLALYSLRQYCAELGREMMTIAPDAEALMRAYSWPGNVRELQNVLRRAMLVAPGRELTAKDLHLEVTAPQRLPPRRRDAPTAPSQDSAAPSALADELADAVARWFWHGWAAQAATAAPPNDAIEAFLLRASLRVAHGSLSDAAKLLDMHPDTFGTHLDKLGDPDVSRTIRHHALGALLEQSVREPDRALRDRILRVLLTELLVYCRGNKSEMARHLGWGRQTLGRQLRRLAVVGQSRVGES